MKPLPVLAVAVTLLVPGALQAQTKTVSKSGSPDFATITEALDFFASETDPASNVIHVTDSEVYQEVLTITTPVTLEATGAERATIVVVGNPAGTGANGGIVINLPETITTGSVKIKDFIILPAPGVAPNSRLRTAIENRNNNLYLELENVLITANKGDNTPLITNAVDNDILKLVPTNAAYDANVVPFGAHGIVLGRSTIDGNAMFEGGGIEFVFKNSIITHLRNDYHPAAVEPERFPTCIVIHAPFGPDPEAYVPPLTDVVRKTHIEGESGISYARVGVSVAGDFRMNSDGARIQMRGAANQAIRFDGPAFNYRTINNVNMTDNSNTGILDRGFGPIRWTMNDSIIFMTLNHNFLVETVTSQPATGLITIENSTLVGGRNHATAGRFHTIRLTPETETDILVRNSILGGKLNHSVSTPENPDTAVAFNVISLPGNNTLTLEGTAVINEGPYSFRDGAPFSRGVNAEIIGTPATEADPLFSGVTGGFNPVDPEFLDVESSAYASISTTGGPLSGGADYVGPDAAVDTWELY